MNMYHFLELVRNVEKFRAFDFTRVEIFISNEQARDEAENGQSFRVI